MVVKDIKIGQMYKVDGEYAIYGGVVHIGKGQAHAFLYEYGTLYLNDAALKNKLNTADFQEVEKK